MKRNKTNLVFIIILTLTIMMPVAQAEMPMPSQSPASPVVSIAPENTVTNPDGSTTTTTTAKNPKTGELETTTTVTAPDGTVTVTIKDKYGTVLRTEVTAPDGTVKITVKDFSGSVIRTETIDANGNKVITEYGYKGGGNYGPTKVTSVTTVTKDPKTGDVIETKRSPDGKVISITTRHTDPVTGNEIVTVRLPDGRIFYTIETFGDITITTVYQYDPKTDKLVKVFIRVNVFKTGGSETVLDGDGNVISTTDAGIKVKYDVDVYDRNGEYVQTCRMMYAPNDVEGPAWVCVGPYRKPEAPMAIE